MPKLDDSTAYAVNWRTVLLVDAALGVVVALAGLVAALVWSPLWASAAVAGTAYAYAVVRRYRHSEAVQRVDKYGLSVLTTGPLNELSSELLSSDQFYKLLDEAVQTYEVVILDGPPILASSDALVIAKHMSGILWVVDKNRVDLKTLTYALNQLVQVGVTVMGLVANRTKNDQIAQWARRYEPSQPAQNEARSAKMS